MAMPADLARKAHALFTRAMEEDDAARAAFVRAQTINAPALRERVATALAFNAARAARTACRRTG